jgi:hypothetical protein
LPKDLPKAIMPLNDEELVRLLAAAIAETERRRGTGPSRGKREPLFSLTRWQLNAVRAAFKSGVTPARIARQFGLTQSDCEPALKVKLPPSFSEGLECSVNIGADQRVSGQNQSPGLEVPALCSAGMLGRAILCAVFIRAI